MNKKFTPSPDSPNWYERLAWYAAEAGRDDLVEEAEYDFYRKGCEDDCYHEYAG